jgi:hypothetical protein
MSTGPIFFSFAGPQEYLVLLTKSDPNFAFFSAEPNAMSRDTSFNGNFLEIRDHLKVQSDFFSCLVPITQN